MVKENFEMNGKGLLIPEFIYIGVYQLFTTGVMNISHNTYVIYSYNFLCFP
jgi:hypothetical protein